MEREAKSGKGYCDYLFLPKRRERSTRLPAIILELKVGETCEAAIEQIKSRDYLQKARDWGCEDALLTGICYDNKKRHTCKIERVKLNQ